MTQLTGLLAATYTPLDQAGDVCSNVIPALVDRLLDQGISGLYVCGSTGEGMSLSVDERMQVTEAYLNAVSGRCPVIVQVGHNSLRESARLARHAQQMNATAISATCPSYFRVSDVDSLVDCIAEVVDSVPDMPFYYYHIPALTGSAIDVVRFLEQADARLPSLHGVKYTHTTLHEFQECQSVGAGRYQMIWGCDEMLLGALATGATAAIGSTYNVAATISHKLMAAWQSGAVQEARNWQLKSIQFIRVMQKFPFHPAMKSLLTMLGHPCGHCRLPQQKLSAEQTDLLRRELQTLGFFDWIGASPAAESSSV